MIKRHQREDKRSNANPPNGNVARAKAPERKSGVSDWFHKFAHKTSEWVGKPWTFCLALLLIIAWGVSGPLFGFSDTWQLVINTATTIVTFLMVFLIQNTQNRDAKAFHLKLDELIHSKKEARNKLIDLDCLSDEELKELEDQFKRISKVHQRASSARNHNSK